MFDLGNRRTTIDAVTRALDVWAGSFGDADLSHLELFVRPNVADIRAPLLTQDVIFVSGGSVVNLLAVWRAHGLDAILRECWEAGVVLAGQSAGSLCWHLGGVTDSLRVQALWMRQGTQSDQWC
jgi:peptidase E